MSVHLSLFVFSFQLHFLVVPVEVCVHVCVCVLTSGSQSRAMVVYREVTLALGDPFLADYHKACVSGKKEKERG